VVKKIQEKSNWYALYTKPRCEKKVHATLLSGNVESYCPLTRMKKKWSDRYKWVEEPLFKSYVFVKLKDSEKYAVRMTEGVVNFVYWLGKPAVIREEDIITIKKFLKEYVDVKAEPVSIAPDQRVKVTGGALMDQTGKVIRAGKNKVFVMLESIGYKLVAELDIQNVEPIK
jgi:transcription antitermination factor NusG